MPNHLTAGDVETFVMRGDVKTRIFYPNLESPKMFHIGTDGVGGPYLMRLYFDVDKASFQDNKVVMFVRYKEGTEDKFTDAFTSDVPGVFKNTFGYANSVSYMDYGSGSYVTVQNEIRAGRPIIMVGGTKSN